MDGGNAAVNLFLVDSYSPCEISFRGGVSGTTRSSKEVSRAGTFKNQNRIRLNSFNQGPKVTNFFGRPLWGLG